MVLKERLCGILVGAVKSRVHGSSNLTVLMHQHQLLNFAKKFGLLTHLESPPKAECYSAPGYHDYSFLSPLKVKRNLNRAQINHLRQHYRTVELTPDISQREREIIEQLIENIDTNVEVD